MLSLSYGNYVVVSPFWQNEAGIDIGAVTWGDGSSGVMGEITPLNRLVGNLHDDGRDLKVYELSNGDYVVKSSSLDRTPVVVNMDGITWGSGDSGITGPISSAISVIGTTAYGGIMMNFQYDRINDQLVVGRPADNIVTLFKKVELQQQQLYLPVVVR